MHSQKGFPWGRELGKTNRIIYYPAMYRDYEVNLGLYQTYRTRWWFHFFYFHPYLGKIPILTNIFRMGWNHQLEKLDEFHHMLPYKPPMVLQETEETKEAEEVEAVPEAGFLWSPCFFFCWFQMSLRLHGISWGVKTTCFKAPGVSLGGSGVSIGGVRSLRGGYYWRGCFFSFFWF